MPLGLGPFPKECPSLEPGKLSKDFAGGFHSKRIFPGVGSIPSSSLALPLILVSDFATFNKQDSLLRVSALILPSVQPFMQKKTFLCFPGSVR